MLMLSSCLETAGTVVALDSGRDHDATSGKTLKGHCYLRRNRLWEWICTARSRTTHMKSELHGTRERCSGFRRTGACVTFVLFFCVRRMHSLTACRPRHHHSAQYTPTESVVGPLADVAFFLRFGRASRGPHERPDDQPEDHERATRKQEGCQKERECEAEGE